jgi:hypothetical protein
MNKRLAKKSFCLFLLPLLLGFLSDCSHKLSSEESWNSFHEQFSNGKGILEVYYSWSLKDFVRYEYADVKDEVVQRIYELPHEETTLRETDYQADIVYPYVSVDYGSKTKQEDFLFSTGTGYHFAAINRYNYVYEKQQDWIYSLNGDDVISFAKFALALCHSPYSI